MSHPTPVYAKIMRDRAESYGSVVLQTWYLVLRSEALGVWVNLDLTLSSIREQLLLWPDVELQEG